MIRCLNPGDHGCFCYGVLRSNGERGSWQKGAHALVTWISVHDGCDVRAMAMGPHLAEGHHARSQNTARLANKEEQY
jgi:hypothetical protein